MKNLINSLFITLSYVCFFVLIFGSCSKDVADFSFQGIFTYEEQKSIGESLRDELLNNPYNIIPPSNDNCAYKYVSSITEMLVERDMVRNARNFDWKVYLINDADKTTAFTLPGGYIFLSIGLVNYLDTESQLVAVIGHEMAYADKGFITDKLIEKYGSTALIEILKNVSNPSVDPREMALSVADIYYSSATVKEADTYSAAMICPYSYAADGIVKIIEKAGNGRNQIDWFDTKPNYPNRVEFLNSYTAKSCCHGEKTYQKRFEEVKDNCFGIGG